MKGSKVMGKMISTCLESVKSEYTGSLDPGKAARKAWMKPNADDLGKLG